MNGTAEPATRGVVAILLAGAVLGIGFNYLGQKSRPARGLAWIAEPKAFESLEKHLSALNEAGPEGNNPGTGALASIASPAPPPTSKLPPTVPQVATPGASGAREEPAAAPAARPGASEQPSGAVADPDDPLGIEVPSSPDAGLPEIPDLGRPFAVEITTVKRFFDAGAAYIIDARDVEEFEEGHIPGAVNLPFSTAGTDPARLEAIDAGERPIIIYCGGGTCEVSMSLAETLVYQFAKRKVLVYMGGYPEWESAGYPIRRGRDDEVKG